MGSHSPSRLRVSVRRYVFRLARAIHRAETIDQSAQILDGAPLRSGLSAIYRADNITIDKFVDIIRIYLYKKRYEIYAFLFVRKPYW